jgi:serine protease Do
MSEYQHLRSLSGETAALVANVKASVVTVARREGAPRTGFVFADGIIVSVARAAEIGERVSVETANGSEEEAEVVGFDSTSGIGLLSYSAGVPLARRTEAMPVGELTVTVARPSSDGVEARLGMIRCAGGTTHLPGGRRVDHYLQTDAPAYPGFLGAPVFDAGGLVVGITMASRTDGFVLPTAELAKIVEALGTTSEIGMGYLGIRTEEAPVPDSVAPGLDGQATGMLVVSVDADSPAAAAGLVVGDIVVEVDQAAITSLQALADALVGTNGREIPVRVIRGGEVLSITASPTRQHRRRRPRGRHHGRRHPRG